MYVWRKRKDQKFAPSSITHVISGDKSKRAKRQSELIGTLRYNEAWELTPDYPERPDAEM